MHSRFGAERLAAARQRRTGCRRLAAARSAPRRHDGGRSGAPARGQARCPGRSRRTRQAGRTARRSSPARRSGMPAAVVAHRDHARRDRDRGRRGSPGAASPPWRRALSIRLRIIRRSSVRSPRTDAGLPSTPMPSRAASSAASASRSISSLRSGARTASSRLASRISSISWSSSAMSALMLLALLRIGVAVRQRERHVDAGERRAQLVRGVGEQHLVRADQLLDAAGRAVEARRERRDLVLALDLHARRKVAFAELLDAGLQPLQPPREAARQRLGADRDRDRDRRRARRAAHGPGRHGPRGMPVTRKRPSLSGSSQVPRCAAQADRGRLSSSSGGSGRPAAASSSPLRRIEREIDAQAVGAAARSPPAGARAAHPAAAAR